MSASRFILVHSPLVGPTTWRWTADRLGQRGCTAFVPSFVGFERAGPPYVERVLSALEGICSAIVGDVTLVAHSGAGLYMPGLAERLGERVRAVVFVDSGVPTISGDQRVVPSDLRTALCDRARDAVVPPWSSWWGEDAMERLVPDPEIRALVEAELPALPEEYFDSVVTVPEGWSDLLRCAYLRFSDAYLDDEREARRRGWPIAVCDGGHLRMVTHPDEVADALVALDAVNV